MFVGELWADEVSEAEANSVSACRSRIHSLR